MDPELADTAIREFIRLMVERLDQASAIAKAAQACAVAGPRDRAVAIMLDIEAPLYQVNALLNVASFLNRGLDT